MAVSPLITGSGVAHIVNVQHLKSTGDSFVSKRSPSKIGQWVFDIDYKILGWKPLSAAVCESGMIALYPVRKVDLTVKDNSVMHSIIGVHTMRSKIHYLLIDGTGLTGRNWKSTVIDRKR